jgi:hypothetical protein
LLQVTKRSEAESLVFCLPFGGRVGRKETAEFLKINISPHFKFQLFFKITYPAFT